MEADIAQGPIGQVGSYDLEFKGGKLTGKVDIGIAHSVADGVLELNGKLTAEVSLSGHAVIAALKKLIPGQVDDAILSVIEAAVLGS